MTEPTRKDILEHLKTFKARRDDLLYEDTESFAHHLERFVRHVESNPALKAFLDRIVASYPVNFNEWWADLQNEGRHGKIQFPDDPEAEISFRYQLMRDIWENHSRIFSFGRHFGKSKIKDSIDLFRSIVLRPLMLQLSEKMSAAADLATPDAIRFQAVSINRFPAENESMIFLSHKSKDKPLVIRFYEILQQLGLRPWMDKPELPAGKNLERSLLDGFERSCAAIFFLTESFKDENYLATEIDYAIRQKRKKGEKFAIITLRFDKDVPVPGLLEQYVYQDVTDELEALSEAIRALPVQCGRFLWKESVLS